MQSRTNIPAFCASITAASHEALFCVNGDPSPEGAAETETMRIFCTAGKLLFRLIIQFKASA